MKFFERMKGWIVIGLCVSAIAVLISLGYNPGTTTDQKIAIIVGVFILVLIAGPLVEWFVMEKH